MTARRRFIDLGVKAAKAPRKAAAAFAAAVLAFAMCVPAGAAYADLGEPYTYTITLLAGAQGQLSEDVVAVESSTAKTEVTPTKIVISNLSPNDRVSFRGMEAKVYDGSKYYANGVRMSGRDNNTAIQDQSVSVNEDRDYVVSYGMKGNMVEYTVRFVDENGNKLADDRTYFGRVGEMPVIAYTYMDGYIPQAYNLTGTLTENPEDNIFTFTYSRLAANTIQGEPNITYVQTPGTTTVETIPGTTTVVPAPAAPAATGAVAPAPAAQAQATGGTGETYIGENGNPLAAPQQIQNIDDNANPLASNATTSKGNEPKVTVEDGSSMLLWPTILGTIVFIGGVGTLVVWLIVRNRRSREQQA